MTALQGDTNLSILSNAINGLEARMNVSLNSNGTLKDGSVTLASIPDGLITPAKLDASILPPGTIRISGVSAIPATWLECNGAAVSRVTYATLFGVIGTQFGVGDGVTTFNLPNLQDKCPIGAGATYAMAAQTGYATHTLTLAEIPDLTQLTYNYNDAGVSVGYLPLTDNAAWVQRNHNFNPAGGGSAFSIMQPSLAVRFIIKT